MTTFFAPFFSKTKKIPSRNGEGVNYFVLLKMSAASVSGV